MQYRQLGRSGLSVSPLMLGCNVMGWTADEATSFALLDAWASTSSTQLMFTPNGCRATPVANQKL